MKLYHPVDMPQSEKMNGLISIDKGYGVLRTPLLLV